MLEVACGPGKHSNLIAQSYLRPDSSVLVSCDYSNAMVQKLGTNYATSDFSMVAGNKYAIDSVDYCEMVGDSQLKNQCDLDAVIAKHGGEGFRKLVYGCRANNELLPFANETFSAYLANLSVMLVNNPLNQFKEAYRVLQKGSNAVFTIWGKKEMTLQFTHVDNVIEKHLPAEMVASMKAQSSNFDLFYGKHFDVEKTLKEIGFSQTKMWFAPINFMYRSGAEFMQSNSKKLNMLCQQAGFDEAKRQAIYNECVEEFDKVSGAGTQDLRTFEV